MKKSTFEREMNKARLMQLAEHERKNYWMGYQRGLRRRYHGKNFGTDDESQLWLSATGDESRDQRSAGYRAGYCGPDDSPQTIRKWRGWSVDELAERIGRSPRTVEGWEQGREIPPSAQKTLRRIYEK